MGDETEKLIASCKTAMGKVEEWTKSFPNALSSTTKSIERLKTSNGPGNRQGAVTERTFLSNAANMIGLELGRLEKHVKDLESKVKSKKVLDFFKTQKTLGDAKKVLAEGKAAVVAGKKAFAEASSDYAEADRQITALLERMDPPAGLEDCLKAPYLKPFTEFAKQSLALENLELLQLIRSGKAGGTNAPKVYAAYIKVGSPKQANLDDHLVQQFDECSRTNDWSKAPFDAAANHIYGLMENDTYRKFLGSKTFK